VPTPDWCCPPQARDIKGRIYVNEQGVNAQLSGAGDDAVAYAEWVTADPRFAGTRVSVYEAPGHAFPRLTLRYKANLVQLAGGTQHLELSTPAARAHELTPEQWRVRRARCAAGSVQCTLALNSSRSAQCHAACARPDATPARTLDALQEKLRERAAGNGPPVLLDVRNAYEWEVGRFQVRRLRWVCLSTRNLACSRAMLTLVVSGRAPTGPSPSASARRWRRTPRPAGARARAAAQTRH
jgi:hypothetical protein